jgi:hypothetical protein
MLDNLPKRGTDVESSSASESTTRVDMYHVESTEAISASERIDRDTSSNMLAGIHVIEENIEGTHVTYGIAVLAHMLNIGESESVQNECSIDDTNESSQEVRMKRPILDTAHQRRSETLQQRRGPKLWDARFSFVIMTLWDGIMRKE